MATNTNILFPQTPFIDPSTGRPSLPWVLWLQNPSFVSATYANALPISSGGTGISTAPTNGQLLIGNLGNYTLHTLSYSSGISITNGAGLITIANTGVLSNLAGSGISVSNPTGNVTIANTGVLSANTGSGISVSGATGNVTFANTGVLSFSGGSTGLTPATATTGAVSLAGTLAVAYGGTGQTTYTDGQLLIGNTTGNTLAKSTLTAGTGISISNGHGSITIANTLPSLGGTVTSVSVVSANGLAGTVATSTTTPAITLSTTITGLLKGNGTAISAATSGTDYAPATSGTSILYGNGSGGFSNVTIGSGISFVTGTLSATGSGGTVTSVALSLPSIFTVSGSPVTGTGTLTGTFNTQTANYVFAGPTTGAAATPTFRALVSADIPSLSYVSSITSSTLTVAGTSSIPTINLTSGIVTAGTTGSATLIPVVTVDTYGRVTSITTAANPQGTVTSVAALTLGTTGTDLSSTVATGTTTPVITLNVPTASASNRGALSSTDWTTFNNKGSGSVTSVAQSFTGGLIAVTGSPITTSGTLALTVAGTSGGIPYFSSASTWATSAALAANALVIGGGAAVAPSTTTTGTGVLTALGTNVGSAGAFVTFNGALGTPSSGTVTNLTGTAAINITGTAPAGTLTGTTLNSTVVTSSLTTVGTIGTGIWQGTAVGPTYGGTGQTTVTTGDLLYGSASNVWSKLGIGTTGQILRVVSGAPAWGTDYVGTVTSVGGTGTVNGITLTGTVTSSGNLTLGGTLGSIANSQLTNSAVTIGSTSISLGATSTTLAGLTGVTSSAITDSGLTSGRVTYATTSGLLTDSANLLYSGADLTVYGVRVGRGGGAVASNVVLGPSTLANNSTGSSNIAIGNSANNTTTGASNIGIGGNTIGGASAGVTGSNNIGIGDISLFLLTSGTNNIAVGVSSQLYTTTGSYNTSVGVSALNSNGSASNNTAVGYQAGAGITTGGSNVYVGYAATQSGVAVTGEIVVGASITGKGSNTAFIGGTSGAYNGANLTVWSITSDQRIKKNIVDNNIGLDKINAIQVRNFEYRLPEEITEVAQDQAVDKQGMQLGVIAQELQQVLPECVKTESTGVLTVNADNLTWYMINAIKELKTEVDSLKSKLGI